MKYCILGYGARGRLYAELFKNHDNVNLVSVCEKQQDRLDLSKSQNNLPDSALFLNENDFFANGKLADICLITTQDKDHKNHALKALNTGYDLLLEKPIATTEEDCMEILHTAQKLKKHVFVCHVLRYAPFFSTIKRELLSGKYGAISTINLTENVGYWHYAHSYVRGNWRNSEASSPMIIAKSCHDLDVLSWLADTKATSVSSYGSLNYFKEKNAPPNSGMRCLDCDAQTTCPYDAEQFYIKESFLEGDGGWAIHLNTHPTVDNLKTALNEGPYGRCVYKCDNNVVDHQIVNILFDGGITAHLTMTAFSKECYREIHVHCEKGEIIGNMLQNTLTCNIFGSEQKSIDLSITDNLLAGHGGGDALMIKDIVNFYNGNNASVYTSIEKSTQSHLIGFAAEKSRLNNGQVIKL